MTKQKYFLPVEKELKYSEFSRVTIRWKRSQGTVNFRATLFLLRAFMHSASISKWKTQVSFYQKKEDGSAGGALESRSAESARVRGEVLFKGLSYPRKRTSLTSSLVCQQWRLTIHPFIPQSHFLLLSGFSMRTLSTAETSQLDRVTYTLRTFFGKRIRFEATNKTIWFRMQRYHLKKPIWGDERAN